MTNHPDLTVFFPDLGWGWLLASLVKLVSSFVCACSVALVVSDLLWTLVAHQAPLSMGFSRQEYWSGLPFPSPGDLPGPGIELESPAHPALAGRFFSAELVVLVVWLFYLTAESLPSVSPFSPWILETAKLKYRTITIKFIDHLLPGSRYKYPAFLKWLEVTHFSLLCLLTLGRSVSGRNLYGSHWGNE